MKLKANRSFEQIIEIFADPNDKNDQENKKTTNSKKKIVRLAGDEWLFQGPDMYLPRVEVDIVERMNAHVIRYNQALKIRNQGRNVDDRYFWHSMAGANFRMTNLQASIGCAQIKKINKFQTFRKKVFSYYDKKFINDKNISILPKPKFTENSYWLYTILIKNFNEKKRNLLIESLKNNGIETRPGFYPLNNMPGYKKIFSWSI